MILYDYFRSSACYRVRIALNLKNLAYETRPIHLVNEGGEQNKTEYLSINPQGLVPCLALNQTQLTQSLAILEYLEEVYPTPSLLPSSAIERAQVRALALSIACDIHPLNNLRVLNYLRTTQAGDAVQQWYHHWLKKGFDAFEAQLKKLPREKMVCFGKQVSMADLCLIPQVYNAHRMQLNMSHYPLINQINDYCLSLDAFQNASPHAD